MSWCLAGCVIVYAVLFILADHLADSKGQKSVPPSKFLGDRCEYCGMTACGCGGKGCP